MKSAPIVSGSISRRYDDELEMTPRSEASSTVIVRSRSSSRGNGSIGGGSAVDANAAPSCSCVDNERGGGSGGAIAGAAAVGSSPTTEAVANAPPGDVGAAAAAALYRSFLIFSVLFAANHSSGLACLSLASSRLGSRTADWQSGVLYLTYTGSAVLGATYVAKRLGSKAAAVYGMWLFCCYVLCFFLAALLPAAVEAPLAYTGAAIGGVGAGIGWTSEGVYLTQAAEAYSLASGKPWSESTGKLAGVFAFCLLTMETLLDVVSTLLVRWLRVHWSVVFALYAAVAVLSTAFASRVVREYPVDATTESQSTVCHKATAAVRLLVTDSKMKYMIGFNAAFGLTGAFLNSFLSGEVVPRALNDVTGSYVGMLVAIHGIVAAGCSLGFGQLSQTRVGKGPIIVIGALSFASVAIPFFFRPILEEWTWSLLILVYSLQGVGRATFEGTLKAVFADYFPHEKEGAFANIILQYGLASASAYVLSNRLHCASVSEYCIEYQDGSLHDLYIFASLVVGVSSIAIAGYWRASYLFATNYGNHEVSSYRLRSLASYRNSRTPAPRGGRKTYHTLETAVARVETGPTLPEVT